MSEANNGARKGTPYAKAKENKSSKQQQTQLQIQTSNVPTPDSQFAHSESAQPPTTQQSTGDHSTYGTTHTHMHSSHKDATETGANHNTEEGADSDEESDNEPEDARLGFRYPAMSPRNPVRV